MTKYFKDQKFSLFFLHSEAGIFIADPRELVLDLKTNESLVIAARGDVGQTQRDGTVVNFLMILAYDDGDDDDQLPSDCLYFKVNRGGPELVAEFLLSNFASHSTARRYGKDCHPSETEDKNIVPLVVEQMEPASDELRWTYDFSLAGDFEHLAPGQEEYDDDYGFVDGPQYFHYGIDQKARPHLDKLIYIPYRVVQLLTDEQKKKLADELPEIVKNELDYIAIRLFGQDVGNYREDLASDYARMRAASWAADMYDLSGGDGEGNAYLGDGLSITPDGRITDG